MKDKKIINSWRQQEATTMKTNEGLSHGDILQKHLQEIQVHEEIKKKTNPLSLFLSFFFLFFLNRHSSVIMFDQNHQVLQENNEVTTPKEKTTWNMKSTLKKTSMWRLRSFDQP